MRDRPPVIQLLPLGPVPPQELAYATAAVRAAFGVGAEVLPVAPLPPRAFRRERSQYDADALLEHLFDRLAVDVLRLVGITDADLYAEGRNFVFGYAHLRDRIAVLSTRRLRETYWGRRERDDLLVARLEKALAHELGHTFHAPHCAGPRCVMRQVEFLWQLDELEATYCPGCAASVRSVATRGVEGPESLFELAGSYMRRRRYHRAVTTYAEAIRRAPGKAHYHNDHGVALLALGDRLGATRAFRQAVALAPDSPHAYYNLGIVSRDRGSGRMADFFFGEALRRDDDQRAALRYLGILHQDYFHDPRRARRYLRRYRDAGGEEADVLGRLAELESSCADVADDADDTDDAAASVSTSTSGSSSPATSSTPHAA